MNFSEQIKKIKNLNLPSDEFVVVGSGSLAVKAIRDSKDIDIVVTQTLWEELSKKYTVKLNDWGVKTLVLGDDIEVLNPRDSIFGNSKIIPLKEIMDQAEIIEGIRFLNLKHLRQIKQYLGREKDLKDIDLIDEYLENDEYKNYIRMHAPSSELLQRIEKIIGSKPISWDSINKGYTQAERYVMRFENGTSAFVKVATESLTSKWLRDEYKIYSSIKAEFIPQMLGWEDGEYPILILEDLSSGHWPPPWNPDQVQKVLDVIEKVGDLKTNIELQSLKRFESELHGWEKIQKDPSGFLSLGLVTPQWLEVSLPKLIEAESKANLDGDSILHTDIRSDNICFLNDKVYLVDWNWTVRGNVMFDILAWLPSLHAEGGPTPWSFGFNEPELISALAGFHAFHACKPADFKGAEAIRALQLKLLKVYIPWVTKVLNISEPNIQ